MHRRSFLQLIGATPAISLGFEFQPGIRNEIRHDRSETGELLGSGIEHLDDFMGPLRSDDVLTISGPAMSGKTSLALSIAHHVCKVHGRDAIYWGPHIHRDRYLKNALSQFSTNVGTLHLRCMNEPLGDLASTKNLGVLIIDEYSYQLSMDDKTWYQDASILSERYRDWKDLAERTQTLIVIVVDLDSDYFPRLLPCEAPRIDDLGLLGRSAQLVGKVVLISRPFLYEQDLREIGGERWADVRIERQCEHPHGGRFWIRLEMDKHTGLLRDMTPESHGGNSLVDDTLLD